MSGYTGNPDAEAEHALILAENGVRAAQAMIQGPQLTECQQCGETIDPNRVAALVKINMRCLFCISCQVEHDRPPKVRMLDRIL